MIELFLKDVEKELDEDAFNGSMHFIKVNQLVKINEFTFEKIGYILENPTEKWYPERFEIIDKIFDAYEKRALEEGKDPICTIYSESIQYDNGPLANMFIKEGDKKSINILDYRDVKFEIDKEGELKMKDAKKFICDVNKFNFIHQNKN